MYIYIYIYIYIVGGTFIKGDEESKTAAEIIGVAAIKYFDLKQNRITNYVFDYDRMLDPKGNTAVYLLYAYARICSIQAKAGVLIYKYKYICICIYIYRWREKSW